MSITVLLVNAQISAGKARLQPGIYPLDCTASVCILDATAEGKGLTHLTVLGKHSQILGGQKGSNRTDF